VYIGAAPGTHIPLLSDMFPEATFHCYDPRPFHPSISLNSSRIHLYQRLFTDQDAIDWSEKENVFLVSDIRTGDHKTMTKEENEAAIWNDNLLQQGWIFLMNPVQANLKFRLPYANIWDSMIRPSDSQWRAIYGPPYPGDLDKVRYLQGYNFLQAWEPQSSTETRLVPIRRKRQSKVTPEDRDNLNISLSSNFPKANTDSVLNSNKNSSKGEYYQTDWSLLDNEERLFYHNSIVRSESLYRNPFLNEGHQYTNSFINPPELLNDYDSTYEAFILMGYLKKYNRSATWSDVIALSNLITENLNSYTKTKKSLSLLRAKKSTTGESEKHNRIINEEVTLSDHSSVNEPFTVAQNRNKPVIRS